LQNKFLSGLKFNNMAYRIFTHDDITEFQRPPTQVASWLLNKLIMCNEVVLRITETEAYGYLDDKASHAYSGKKRFNATMFGPKGYLYVYKIYGIHNCLNVVCGADSSPAAVLLRAAEVVEGEQLVQERRNRRELQTIASGPANLGVALGIDTGFDGIDLLACSPVRLGFDGTLPPENQLCGRRIGLGKRADEAALYHWRYGVPSSPSLTKSF
jgi:DNA-3-methyladenine glycosylase